MTEQPAQDTPAPEADGRDWRQAYGEEVERSRRYRRRAQQAEQALRQLQETAIADEQVEALQRQADEAETARLRIQRLEATLASLAGRDALVRGLVACGVGRGLPCGDRMIEQAVALLQPHVEVDVSGDEPRCLVRGGEGDLAAFVADWLAREGPHFLPPTGDTGSGALPGSGAAATASLADLDAHPDRKATFIAENGLSAYVKLACRNRQRQ